MSKRIDFAITNAWSLKLLNVHGASPLDMLTEPKPGTADNVHGAFAPANVHRAAALGNVHGAAHKVTCVHGACDLTLGAPQQVSRVEVRRGADGEMWITLHE